MEDAALLQHLTWFRQAAFRWSDGERTIYIDPWGTPEDIAPADVICITHAHHDHFRPDEIARLSTPRTRVYAPHDVAADLRGNITPVEPGGTYEGDGLLARALQHETDHTKGTVFGDRISSRSMKKLRKRMEAAAEEYPEGWPA